MIDAVSDIVSLSFASMCELDALPEASCVYFAMNVDKVLYIGKAINLKRRWQKHHRMTQLLEYVDVDIHYKEVQCTELGVLEKECIARFDPVLNGTPKPDTLCVESTLDAIERQSTAANFLRSPENDRNGELPVTVKSCPDEGLCFDDLLVHLSQVKGCKISAPTLYRWFGVCGTKRMRGNLYSPS